MSIYLLLKHLLQIRRIRPIIVPGVRRFGGTAAAFNNQPTAVAHFVQAFFILYMSIFRVVL